MGIKKLWNRFLVAFINGIVILLPVIVTIAVIRFLAAALNNMVLNPVMNFLAPIAHGVQHVYMAKTIVFFIVIFAVVLIGWGARIIVVNRIFSWGERFLLKVPVMGRIYNAFKQIFSSIFGHGKTVFKQVVLVEYPRKGLYSVGFTTAVTKGELKENVGESAINVFVPTAPNPTSGVFLIVPQESVHFLKMSVEEGMTLVVSGGAVMPSYENKEKKSYGGRER